MTLENWNAKKLDRYADAVARGLHDDDCEQRERFGLCHCSKRSREAKGLTTPPSILYRSPECSECFSDLDHDGDSWRCHTCATSWSTDASEGDRGEFMDDHGPDALGDERWGRRLLDIVEPTETGIGDDR